jgi:hypothetical protein
MTLGNVLLRLNGMLKSILSAKSIMLLGSAALSMPLLTSCQTAETPASAMNRQPVANVVGPQSVDSSPVTLRRGSGNFPTFDGQLTAAGQQLSDEEAKQMDASLSRYGSARGSVSEADYNRRVQELRTIGEAPKQP